MNQDQIIEQQIQAEGKTAARVTPEQIEALLARMVYYVEVPEDTTSTFAHAYLDGQFYLDSGHSACVSPENFSPEIGRNIALDKAEQRARERLWELEGYRLYQQLQEAKHG